MTDVDGLLDRWMTEAFELRFNEIEGHAPEIPDPELGPPEILASLLRIRKRLDRVDGLLFRAAKLRSRAQIGAAADEASVSDKWATELGRVRNAPARHRDDFSGPRERYAEADLAVLDLRRTARLSASTAAAAKDAYDVISKCWWGLDGLRQDHLAVLRTLQFESSLER